MKKVLLHHFSVVIDQVNKSYYTDIFSYLEYPVIFFTFGFFLIILFYDSIKKRLNEIKNDIPFLILALVINLLIQILILFFIKTIPIADSKYYIDLAVRLYKTGSYINTTGHLTSFWPIGLPAYLTGLMYLSSHYLFLAKITNIIISTSFILVLYFLFRNEFSIKGRIIFLFALVLYPNNFFSSNCIMADFPFAFLLWLSVLIFLKYESSSLWIILVSIILGVMAYLRPIGLLLPVIFGIFLIRKKGLRSSLKKISLILIFFCLLVAPWTYRNYKLFHELIPISTNGGFNFLMGNHVNSKGNVNFNFHYNNSLSEPEASREAYIKGIDDIITHPIESIIRLPQKIFFSYYRGDSSITWSLKETKNRLSPIVLSFAFFSANYLFYLLVAIGILYLFTNKKIINNKRLKYFIISLYVYFILIIIIYVGGERYLIPVLPIHFFWVGKYFS